MTYVIWMVALMSATWIYWDAAGKKIGKVPGGFGKNYSAGGWAIFATLIPIVGLIIYLRQRPKLIEQASLHPVEASTGLKVTHGVLTIFACIALLGALGSGSAPTQSTTAEAPAQIAVSGVPDASSPVASSVTADTAPAPGKTFDGNLDALIPKERLLFWEDVQTRADVSFEERKLILDSMNKRAENDVAKASTFVPPKKDDFEKQADYEVRLGKAQGEFNSTEAVADTNGYRFKLIQHYFNPMVGKPEIDGGSKDFFKYDAETEVLSLVIRNDDDSESMYTPVLISGITPEIGKAFQTLSYGHGSEACLKPRIGMEWLANRLTAKLVLFDYHPSCAETTDYASAYNTIMALPDSHPLKAGVVINHQYPVLFGKETADNYDKTIAAAAQVEEQRRTEEFKTAIHKAEEMAKGKSWEPLFSEIKEKCNYMKISLIDTAKRYGDNSANYQVSEYKKNSPQCFE